MSATAILLIGGTWGSLVYSSQPTPNIPALDLPKPGEDVDIDIQTDANFSGLPNKAPIYKIQKHVIQPPDVAALASKFSMTETVQQNSTGFVVDQGNKHFWHSTDTDQFSYYEQTPQSTGYKMIPTSEAREKAMQVLKDFNIPTNDLKFSGITYMTFIQGNGSSVPTVEKVNFQQTLNGRPLYGVARVTIMFGDQGKLVGVYNLRKDFVESGNVNLTNASNAYSNIRSNGIINASSQDKHGTIHKARLEYWADPGDDQPYIQPIFVFDGSSENSNPVHAYVPAVDSSETTSTQPTANQPTTAKVNPDK